MNNIKNYISRNAHIDGTICNLSDDTGLSLSLGLTFDQAKELIIDLQLLDEELSKSFAIKDKRAKKTLVFQKHNNYSKSIVKGKLRSRSVIAYNHDLYTFNITKNDLNVIIKWYLRSFVDVEYIKMTLDIQCENNSIMIFSID